VIAVIGYNATRGRTRTGGGPIDRRLMRSFRVIGRPRGDA
jgi:hypothetical protein